MPPDVFDVLFDINKNFLTFSGPNGGIALTLDLQGVRPPSGHLGRSQENSFSVSSRSL